MENLKTYSELNESLFANRYINLQTKVLKDIGINLYFIGTFGTSITALYPFFSKLVESSQFENTISEREIVLLGICTLTILLKDSKSNIDKLVSLVEEKGLKDVLKYFISSLENLNKLFKSLSKSFGVAINGLVDMFSYTALFVPFLIGLLDTINLYQLGFTSFDQILTNPKGAAISTGVGVISISLKHIINMVIKRIKRKQKSKKTPKFNSDVVQKFESVELIVENYFNI